MMINYKKLTWSILPLLLEILLCGCIRNTESHERHGQSSHLQASSADEAMVRERIQAMYKWYIPMVIKQFPRTAFDEKGPYLEGKELYLDLVSESQYFSDTFVDSLAEIFRSCEIEGRKFEDLDHLSCEEADPICFWFLDGFQGLSHVEIEISEDKASANYVMEGYVLNIDSKKTMGRTVTHVKLSKEHGDWQIDSIKLNPN